MKDYDRHWKALRAQVLAEEPGCRECGSTEQPEVDHIDGNPKNRDRSNLRRLCKPHHSARTARDQAFGKAEPGWKRSHPVPDAVPVLA